MILSLSLYGHIGILRMWHFKCPGTLFPAQLPNLLTGWPAGLSRVHAGNHLARYDWLQAILSGIKLYVFMNS